MDIVSHMTLKLPLINGLLPSEKLAKKSFNGKDSSSFILPSTPLSHIKDFAHPSPFTPQPYATKSLSDVSLKRLKMFFS